jgi:hypothetical protein
MESLTIYPAFAYIDWPTDREFNCLFAAQKALQKVFWHFNWKVTPSNHWMMTHSIQLAIKFKTAKVSLQEGVEKGNDIIKRAAEHTFKGWCFN